MELKTKTINYCQLREGLNFEYDKYHVLSYQYETRRRTLLANPFLSDDERTYAVIGLADGIIVGRTTLFPGKFKAGENVIDSSNGTSYHVEEQFRKEGIGADIFIGQIKNCGCDIKISAGLSDMALPINMAMKHVVFKFPSFWYLKKWSPLLHRLHFNGWLYRVLAPIVDAPLRLWHSIIARLPKVSDEYAIKEVKTVPEWVDDIVLNDGHKFAEVHDHRWLQWNLDYNFCGGEGNCQRFFTISKAGRPAGFFMLKERAHRGVWHFNDAAVGYLVEWGVTYESGLSEVDITSMSLRRFSPEVAIVEVATTDGKVASVLQKMGFMKKGMANVSFKDIKKRYPDSSQKELWRLRLGYSDVIMSS